MIRPLLLTAALLSAPLAIIAAPAALPGSAPSPTVAPDGELLDHMYGLKRNLKGLARALGGDDRETALEHVAEMQRFVLLAKLESPPTLAEVPEAEQAAHRDAFRADLVRVLQELAAMELEILAGEPQKALARVKGDLFEMRNAGHEAYQTE